MNPNDDFDLTVSAWLHEDAEHRVPDHLAAVLRRTGTERQRSAWSSLERWLPVQTTLRFVPIPRIAWLLVILAFVIALGAAVLAVGSRPRQLPPPFGLARNGTIVFGGSDQDIHTVNPLTGATAALIAGPDGDHDASMSSDGTRLLFLRDTTIPDPVLGTFEPMVMIANADGSDVRALTPALAGIHNSTRSPSALWSSDGTRLAIARDVGGKPAIEIVTIDGPATPVVVDTGGRSVSFMSFRPGDREVTFLGSTADVSGLYAVGTDGRGLRTIKEPVDADSTSLSPSGKEIAYSAAGGPLNAYNTIFVVDVDSGLSRIPALLPPATGQNQADAQSWWSPDGTRLLFQRYVNGQYFMAVAPATGGPVVEIGPTMPQNGGKSVEAQFSPDGLQVLVHFDDGGATWLLDATGATPGTQLPATIAQNFTWQRLALTP